MGDFLKIRPNGTESRISVQDAQQSHFAQTWPCLHEWMVLSTWEDGKERMTATQMLFVEDGRWKICLHDRDGARSVFVAGFTLEDAFTALEEGLLGQNLDWRTRSPQANGKPKRT